MEQSIILIGGSPGSGKTRLASALTTSLEAKSGIIAEHMSLGDRLRHIGRGAIESIHRREIIDHLALPDASTQRLREDVVEAVVYEALEDSNTKGVDVVLLDGFPRYADQVHALQFFSLITDRSLLGAIMAEIDEHTALSRILKRSRDHSDRRLSENDARAKLRNYYEHRPETMLKLREVLPAGSIKYVVSNLSPSHTAEVGYNAAVEILNSSRNQD